MISLNYVYPSLTSSTRELHSISFITNEHLAVQVYPNCYALAAKDLTNINGEHCLGGGLCCEGEWVYNSGLNLHSLTPYDFNPEDVEYLDEDVVFLGILSSVWGHSITDGLQHLWWFSTEEYQSHYSDRKIVYWGERPLSGNFLDLVRYAGIDTVKLYYIKKDTRFRSVLVPDSCFVSDYPKGIHYHPEYVRIIDLIISKCDKINTKKYKKVFFSEREDRRNWGGSHIEKIVRKAGYHVVFPGDYSLIEQIAFLQGAEDVVSYDSSVGHNVIFCKPGTRIILLRKANFVNNYQSLINRLREYNVTIIDVHLSLMNNERFPYAGPFFVYANSGLCDYLRIPRPAFPWALLKKYIRYCLYDCPHHLLAKFKVPDEYLKIFIQEIEIEKNGFRKRLERVMCLFHLPPRFRSKLIEKMVKYRIRHLL